MILRWVDRTLMLFFAFESLPTRPKRCRFDKYTCGVQQAWLSYDIYQLFFGAFCLLFDATGLILVLLRLQRSSLPSSYEKNLLNAGIKDQYQ